MENERSSFPLKMRQIDQKGVIPLLILIAVAGIVAILAVAGFAPFKNSQLGELFPKTTSQAAVDEWTQDGHDAQRTGSTSEEPKTPWTFKWAFNGPDANGGRGGHIQDAPKEARIVTGGANIYVPLGPKGIFGLRKTNGTAAWNVTATSFNAAPAYDPATQTVIAGGADGKVYKIDANSGAVIATYTAGNPVNKPMLLTGGFAYAVTDSGQLHKISITSMTSAWVYSAGSASHTQASYSPSRDALVFATADLNIHAVNNSNGSQKWKVKPTPNSPGFPNSFQYGWPVIAEKNGIVFLRLQVDHQGMYEGPDGGRWATTNAANRTWLTQNPQWKTLFALNLDNGTEKFIPAVGYGSTEDWINNGPYGVMPAQPVIRVYPDGTEVAYIHFRNGQTDPPTDYRWSGHMGEMVLNNNTVPGMVAGDLRFVRYNNFDDYGGTAYTHIIDEQTPLSMAGNILFNAHWAASTGMKIVDRSNSKGLTYSNPIEADPVPTVIRAQKSCSNFNAATHYTTCELSYVTDGGRGFWGPGFWGYWNVADPPGWRVGSGNTVGTTYSSGFQPRYTYVSDGLMIVGGNGGDILVFSHSGSVSQTSPSPTVIPTPSPSIPPSPSPGPSKPGDIDGDNDVDIFDYNIILTNFGKTGTSIQGDLDKNGKVDIFDYNIVLTNFGK